MSTTPFNQHLVYLNKGSFKDMKQKIERGLPEVNVYQGSV